MSMENAVTSERAKPKDHILYNFVCEISKKGIYIETWKQISDGKIWKDEKERLVTVDTIFLRDENASKLIMVLIVQSYNMLRTSYLFT